MAVEQALRSVTDPEIPVLSVVDLGIIARIEVTESRVVVDMTPTFVGCPALEVIRRDITRTITALGVADVAVNVVYEPPWTSARITPEGRRRLMEFGIAPPTSGCMAGALPDLAVIPCPHCRSQETDLESIFGPTLCRSIHYCRSCRQSFEHFKSLE